MGLLTGADSGFIVVDVDGPAGWRSWELLGLGREMDTLAVMTGRGRHFYFLHPGRTIKTRAGVLPGVDVRADGAAGSIVAPPSNHANGSVYTFVDEAVAMRRLPNVLLDVLSRDGDIERQMAGKSTGANDDREEDFIPDGRRNEMLYKIGCAMRGRGSEYEEILEELMNVNNERCETPVSDNEVKGIAESAATKPRGLRPATRVKVPRTNGGPVEENPLFYMQFKPDEWLADDQVQYEMTDRQRGWYINLLCLAWKNKGLLPNDPVKLYRRANVTDCNQEEFADNLTPIMALLDVDEEDKQTLVHPTIRSRWQKQYDQHIKNQDAGKKSAEKRRTRSEGVEVEEIQ